MQWIGPHLCLYCCFFRDKKYLDGRAKAAHRQSSRDAGDIDPLNGGDGEETEERGTAPLDGDDLGRSRCVSRDQRLHRYDLAPNAQALGPYQHGPPFDGAAR